MMFRLAYANQYLLICKVGGVCGYPKHRAEPWVRPHFTNPHITQHKAIVSDHSPALEVGSCITHSIPSAFSNVNVV